MHLMNALKKDAVMNFIDMVFNSDEVNFAAAINAHHKRLCADDPTHIVQHQELLRAKWAIWYSRHESIQSASRRYGISPEMFKQLVGETIPEMQKRQKRTDKYETIKQWCLENHLVQVSVNAVAEIGNFSYPTALKFINDRPDLFYKVKRGVYEVRNPNIVKEEEKLRTEK
jgi:hypothetical protein